MISEAGNVSGKSALPVFKCVKQYIKKVSSALVNIVDM